MNGANLSSTSLRLLDADRAYFGALSFSPPHPPVLLIDAPNGVEIGGNAFFFSPNVLKITGVFQSNFRLEFDNAANAPTAIDAISFQVADYAVFPRGVMRLRGTPDAPASLGGNETFPSTDLLFADRGILQTASESWFGAPKMLVGDVFLDGFTGGDRFAGSIATMVVRGGLFGSGSVEDLSVQFDGATATTTTALGGISMAPRSLFSPGRDGEPGLFTIKPRWLADLGAFEMIHDPATVFDLGGTARGSEYDALLVTGPLTLDGAFELRLGLGFHPSEGDTFDLFDFGSLIGRFDTVSLPLLAEGLAWNDSQLYVDGTITVIPEPSSAVLLLSVVAFGCTRTPRRRNCGERLHRR
jgi:hypothetical protein